MDINQKTANIPFWVLYGVVAGIALFDLIFTYTFLSSNPEAYEGNPINAYLADIIGLEYFLFMIPVSLLVLYGITKLGAWAIRRVDKTTEINGEKYMAVILILLTFPNVLLNEIFLILFGSQLHVSRFDPALVLAIVLTLSYILWTEMADRKAKKKKTETAV